MVAETDVRQELELQKTVAAEEIVCKAPTGPACAAVLAAGIGSAAYGIAVVVAAASPAAAKFMTWSSGVGPLSGKTSIGVIVWAVAQAILCTLWHKREVNFQRVWVIALILMAAGFVFTFPPVYDHIAELAK